MSPGNKEERTAVLEEYSFTAAFLPAVKLTWKWSVHTNFPTAASQPHSASPFPCSLDIEMYAIRQITYFYSCEKLDSLKGHLFLCDCNACLLSSGEVWGDLECQISLSPIFKQTFAFWNLSWKAGIKGFTLSMNRSLKVSFIYHKVSKTSCKWMLL